jgi:hypothetical protein
MQSNRTNVITANRGLFNAFGKTVRLYTFVIRSAVEQSGFEQSFPSPLIAI